MSRPSAVANEQTGEETSAYTTYLDLVRDCRAVAPRVFSKHSAMFPQGLHAMCSLDPTLVAAPLVVQIRNMRNQLDFLKSLDESPMYDPGVLQFLQMDGDIGDTTSN